MRRDAVQARDEDLATAGGAEAPPRRSLRPLVLTLVLFGVALGLFDYFSAGSAVARRALISDRPPVYGRFEPGFATIGVVALVLAVGGGALAYLFARRERVRAAWFLLVSISFMVVFAASVAVVDGSSKAYTDPLERTRAPDYQTDVHLLRERGVRSFVREHPDLMPQMRSVHSRTHPPGPIVLLSALQSAFPDHLVPRAIILALLSALVLIPTWLIARTMYGERAALVAVVLLMVAPAPVIFGFTSMDGVYATLLASTGFLLFRNLGPRGDTRGALIAGAVTGFVTFMTYGVLFVTAGAAIYAFVSTPRARALRSLVAAAAGGLGALLILRLALGFDLLGSFNASYGILADESARSYVYWIFGNPAVWLTFAGLPIAALAVRELFEHRPRYLIALFVPLLLIDLNHKFAGETERIGQFAYPFIAAAAGGWIARWEGRRPWPLVIAALVVIAALQSVLLEALYYTFW